MSTDMQASLTAEPKKAMQPMPAAPAQNANDCGAPISPQAAQPPAPGNDPVACLENKAEKAVEEKFVSAGHKIHNEITYRGVDFLLNSAVGVAMTYWSSRTHSGQQYFQQPVTNFFKKVLKPFARSEKALDEGARWGSMFTSIIVGGTAIMAVLVPLEHKPNKKAIIRHIDHKIYGKERVENDPRFAEQHQNIEDEPRKNFTTGMIARFIVLAPMIAATLHDGTNKQMIKYLYNPVAKSSKWLCRQIGLQPRSLMERGAEEIVDGDITGKAKFFSDWDFIHRTIGFDLGLTFIYSFAHEATYKTLAAMGFKKNEEPESATSTLTLIDAPAASTDVTVPSEQLRRPPSGRQTPTSNIHIQDFTHQPEAATAELMA